MSVNVCLSLCVRPLTDSTHAVVNLENASKYLIINCQVTFQDGCQVSKLAYVVVVFELLSFRSNTQGLWVSFRALKFIIVYEKKSIIQEAHPLGNTEASTQIYFLCMCAARILSECKTLDC